MNFIAKSTTIGNQLLLKGAKAWQLVRDDVDEGAVTVSEGVQVMLQAAIPSDARGCLLVDDMTPPSCEKKHLLFYMGFPRASEPSAALRAPKARWIQLGNGNLAGMHAPHLRVLQLRLRQVRHMFSPVTNLWKQTTNARSLQGVPDGLSVTLSNVAQFRTYLGGSEQLPTQKPMGDATMAKSLLAHSLDADRIPNIPPLNTQISTS